MKKKIHYLLIICIIITNLICYSQCSVTAKALYQGNVFTDTVEICSGSMTLLYADANCLDTNCGAVIMQNDFNNQSLGNDIINFS